MFRYLLLAMVLVGGALTAAEYPQRGPDIYDPKSNGNDQVARALAQAKRETKHVLLDFGANWCPWCHKLHRTLTTDAGVSQRLSRDFVLVLIDVNTRNGTKRNADVNERYGNPIQHGLPVLVVLDGAGKVLVTQETGALEDGSQHDPRKVAAFLDRWSPRRQ